MKKTALFLALCSPLGGCAGSIVGDAMAGPERLAQRDNDYCQSIGALPGTQAYMSCRMQQDQLRESHHSRGAAMVGAGAALAGQR